MLTLRGLAALLVQSSHAFLETQEGLVDFCTFCLSVFVIALTVLSTFATSQIYQKQLAALADTLLLNLDLSDGVASTRCVVGLGGVGRSHLVALLDQVQYLIIVVDKLLLQSSNLDSIRFILSELQFIVIVKKIVNFTTIDLVHGNSDREVSLVVLPVVYASFK